MDKNRQYQTRGFYETNNLEKSRTILKNLEESETILNKQSYLQCFDFVLQSLLYIGVFNVGQSLVFVFQVIPHFGDASLFVHQSFAESQVIVFLNFLHQVKIFVDKLFHFPDGGCVDGNVSHFDFGRRADRHFFSVNFNFDIFLFQTFRNRDFRVLQIQLGITGIVWFSGMSVVEFFDHVRDVGAVVRELHLSGGKLPTFSVLEVNMADSDRALCVKHNTAKNLLFVAVSWTFSNFHCSRSQDGS